MHPHQRYLPELDDNVSGHNPHTLLILDILSIVWENELHHNATPYQNIHHKEDYYWCLPPNNVLSCRHHQCTSWNMLRGFHRIYHEIFRTLPNLEYYYKRYPGEEHMAVDGEHLDPPQRNQVGFDNNFSGRNVNTLSIPDILSIAWNNELLCNASPHQNIQHK